MRTNSCFDESFRAALSIGGRALVGDGFCKLGAEQEDLRGVVAEHQSYQRAGGAAGRLGTAQPRYVPVSDFPTVKSIAVTNAPSARSRQRRAQSGD
jgi:hypothetical protein